MELPNCRFRLPPLPPKSYRKFENAVTPPALEAYAYDAHCVLVLPVVGEPELRNVGRASHADNPETGIIRKGCVETIRRQERKTEPDAAIVEAEFVGPARANHISVREAAGHGPAGEAVIKTRKVVQGGRLDGVVIEPTEAHVLLVRNSMIDADLVVVVQR